MRVHVIGAGPTGMSIAWEVLRSTDHEVIVYDRKPSVGGSWWEPSADTRDIHAHRIVFDNAFVNTDSLFREMDIKWGDVFEPVDTGVYQVLFKNLHIRDYAALTSLAARVLAKQTKYKSISLKDALDPLSESGENLIRTITYVMDGVGWETMSAYEFVNSFDHVGLSKQCTQRVSGKHMNDAMQNALLEKGATFMFNTHLENVDYRKDGYTATFKDGVSIDDGLLVLCVDNSKALELIGDNWGEDAAKKIGPSTYGCINVLLDYDEPVKLESDLHIGMNTRLRLQPVVLADGNTVSCVICDLTEEVLAMEPDVLKAEVIRELNLPEPTRARIGWGAEWKDGSWRFEQSSGVLSLHGQLPFFGESPNVAMCGMMSPRNTPYSSIEAAIEVGRSFCHQEFGTRKPHQPIRITLVLFVLIALILIIIYTRKS